MVGVPGTLRHGAGGRLIDEAFGFCNPGGAMLRGARARGMAALPEGREKGRGMRVSTLVIGGARSGKSRFAQALAEAESGPLVYVATAEALDGEMADRIARHQADRGARWTTREAPHDLAAAIAGVDPGATMLVDCLTLWLSNRMLAGADLDAEAHALVAAIGACPAARLVLVSNEVGFGIVPETPLGRAFRDRAGWLNQAVAAAADRVALVVAGLPLWLKN